MSEDYTDLKSVAAGMEQGFQQRGGYDNCLYMLRKVVEVAQANTPAKTVLIAELKRHLNQLAKALVIFGDSETFCDTEESTLWEAVEAAREIIAAREAG